MKRKNINIAVSGLNATDNPGPGVPVIRSIRESEEFQGTITGLAYDPLDPGIYMRDVCDNVFLMPYPSEGAENILERIRYIHAQKPIDVIISTLDSELEAYLKISQDLFEMGIHTFLPAEDALKLRSKSRLHELSKIGISVPKGKAVTDITAIYQLEEDFNFPVVVKGQFYEAYIAHSVMEAVQYFSKISSRWGLPVIIQEYIIGVEYDIVALGDGDGGLVGAVPMKKMQLTDKGKAWGGITVDDPDMNEFVRHTIRKLKWRGPCELEVMKEKATGKYYLIEINPRFPAWCYLSVGAGQNLPWAAVKLALGETTHPFPPCKVGALFLRNSVDCVYPLSEYQSVITRGELVRITTDA
ncbi:MAG: ATP-grasp domain-containing protein [Deltaproteobacteria bacterium]